MQRQKGLPFPEMRAAVASHRLSSSHVDRSSCTLKNSAEIAGKPETWLCLLS